MCWLPRLTLLALLSRHLILANGGLILLGHTLHRLRIHRSGLSGRLSRLLRRLLRRLLMGALLSLLGLLLGGLLLLSLLLLGLLLSVLLLLLERVLLGGHGCLRIMGLGEGESVRDAMSSGGMAVMQPSVQLTGGSLPAWRS